jgi:metallophosphoesterase (TIGR00282 family)
LKILYIAELVGKAGLYSYRKSIDALKQKTAADFVIVCADAVTSGNGLGRQHAAYIRKLGADIITTGDCCFFKKDLTENFDKIPYVLRPENLSAGAPGLGARVFKLGAAASADEKSTSAKIGCAVMLGQSYFSRTHSESPFMRLPLLLERLAAETPFIFIDFHAASSAEKRTLFELAAGRASAVIGSHTRVQTGDEQIINGTAVITDAGRTGSIDSVSGNDIKSRIDEYLYGIPDWTRDAWARLEAQGVLVTIGDDGKATAIERIKHPIETPPSVTTQETQ